MALDLEEKLAVLMALAADDREGLPPRLQHSKEVGALRPSTSGTCVLCPAPG